MHNAYKDTNMDDIQLHTLMDAYRYLMEVYWLPEGKLLSYELKESCMQTAVKIKVSIGSTHVPIVGPTT